MAIPKPLATFFRDVGTGVKNWAQGWIGLGALVVAYSLFKGELQPWLFWASIAVSVLAALGGAWWTQYKKREDAEAKIGKPNFAFRVLSLAAHTTANAQSTVVHAKVQIVNHGSSSAVLEWWMHCRSSRYRGKVEPIGAAELENRQFYRQQGEIIDLGGADLRDECKDGVGERLNKTGFLTGEFPALFEDAMRDGHAALGIGAMDYMEKIHGRWFKAMNTKNIDRREANPRTDIEPLDFFT